MRQIFHVLEGAVNVRIHMSSYILATGGTFLVPRGELLLFHSPTEAHTFDQATCIT